MPGNGLYQFQKAGFHSGQDIALTALAPFQRRQVRVGHLFNGAEIAPARWHPRQLAVLNQFDHLRPVMGVAGADNPAGVQDDGVQPLADTVFHLLFGQILAAVIADPVVGGIGGCLFIDGGVLDTPGRNRGGMHEAARHIFQRRADHGPGPQDVIPVLLLVAASPQTGITGHMKHRVRGCRHHQGQLGGIVQRSLYHLNALGLECCRITVGSDHGGNFPAPGQQLIDDMPTEKAPGPTHKCHWHGHAPLFILIVTGPLSMQCMIQKRLMQCSPTFLL